MEFSPTGLIAAVLVIAGVGGGTYAITGKQDFIVDVGRPLPEVYETFKGVRTFGSGLRAEGFDVPEITVTRPSDHELVFTTPSANPEQSSRIAFTFAPGANPTTTRVTAAIDVPPVEMPTAGPDKVLSEDKVEAKFREAIADIAKDMNSGNSTTASANRLTVLLDTVAIASHPKVMGRMQARVERLKAAETRINGQLRAERETRETAFKHESRDFRFGDPTDGHVTEKRRFTRELIERIATAPDPYGRSGQR